MLHVRHLGFACVDDPTHPRPLVEAVTPVPSDRTATSRPRRRVNTSTKGTVIEAQAMRLLEAEGYRVHRCVRTGAKRGPLWISQSNDVFGCIDLVAKKKGERTRWIQVTADSGIGRKRDEILGIPWNTDHDSVEIWRWVGGRGRKSKVGEAWLERQYFQVYVLETGFALEKDRRVQVNPVAPTPGGNAT